jgi:hypothetical protein
VGDVMVEDKPSIGCSSGLVSRWTPPGLLQQPADFVLAKAVFVDARSKAYTSAMSHRVRYLILWFLLLALPMQGWAMVTLLPCGGGHQTTMQVRGDARELPPTDEAHALHDHGQHGVVMGDSSDLDNSGSTTDGTTTSQCSACASCCLGAVLPTSALIFDASPPRALVVAMVTTPALNFFTSGPDRPPRHPFF